MGTLQDVMLREPSVDFDGGEFCTQESPGSPSAVELLARRSAREGILDPEISADLGAFSPHCFHIGVREGALGPGDCG